MTEKKVQRKDEDGHYVSPRANGVSYSPVRPRTPTDNDRARSSPKNMLAQSQTQAFLHRTVVPERKTFVKVNRMPSPERKHIPSAGDKRFLIDHKNSLKPNF